MSDVTLSYKGSDILELSDSGSATLKTGGTYCEADIELEYVKPSGGGTSALEEWLTNYFTEQLTGDIVFDFPEITFMKRSAFRQYPNITKACFPHITNSGSSVFDGCTSITVLSFPKLLGGSGTTIGAMNNLLVLELGGEISSNMFNVAKLQTLILRKANSIAAVAPSTMNNTPAKRGGAGITVYIPKVLYDHLGDGSSLDYKSATNWSLYDGYGTITWAQIEGSQYETHYADGTEITS